MENTPHVMLVGDGAREFAIREGLESIKVDSQKLHKEWHQKQSEPIPNKRPKDNHDTVALLVLDRKGHIAGGCSTSGWGGKLPGRVGDSPIHRKWASTSTMKLEPPVPLDWEKTLCVTARPSWLWNTCDRDFTRRSLC
jgi:isoaspartyl peptidase/L-asparaginase-like protein (Ntn-hydrolase superfamily)